MPLAGTFDVLDIGEVLDLMARREVTGRLQVRTSSMHGTIWLAEGQATSAELGSTAGGETRNRWRIQLEEICFDALRSTRGSFEFHPEDASVVPAGARVKLDEVVDAGRRRMAIWEDVESVIHSFEAVPRLAESLGDDSLTVGPDHWKVLVAVDGRRTLTALAKRLDIELLEFCQLIKPLVESGAIVLEQPEGWLKSLPKVRLDNIDPETIIEPPSENEGMALVNVNSTVVNGTVPAVPVDPTPRSDLDPKSDPEPPPSPPSHPARRRVLLARTRSAGAGTGG